MEFLDLNGLTHFLSKVKTFVSNNYLSLKGGTINGNINISGNVSALQFKKTNGTSTQVLIADGSVKGINSANGIAGLDAKGYVPLAQLGNLDTTVAEVVTALPTTNIKKHIYLVKDASGVTQNQYEEYLYIGDTSAAYDASKWEKLGDFRATVDLKDYSKKSETISRVNWDNRGENLVLAISLADGNTTSEFMPIASSSTNGAMSNSDKVKLDKFDISSISDDIDVSMLITAEFDDVEINSSDNSISVSLATLGGSSRLEFSLPAATSKKTGVMSAADKTKLDGIANNANNYSLPTASSTIKGGITLGYPQSGKNYPVALDSNGKAYVNVPWTDTNTTYSLATSTKDGLMKASDKAKLDGIPSNATADSAITTAEIDKLFT